MGSEGEQEGDGEGEGEAFLINPYRKKRYVVIYHNYDFCCFFWGTKKQPNVFLSENRQK